MCTFSMFNNICYRKSTFVARTAPGGGGEVGAAGEGFLMFLLSCVEVVARLCVDFEVLIS